MSQDADVCLFIVNERLGLYFSRDAYATSLTGVSQDTPSQLICHERAVRTRNNNFFNGSYHLSRLE